MAPRFLLALWLLAAGCGDAPESVQGDAYAGDSQHVVVRTGADVLAARGFEDLAGQRVGLIVNHTARVDSAHLIDRLAAASEVQLAALFGPEHGLRGTADAGEEVLDGRDTKTGAPIFSLYGATRKPTSDMLRDVDVLVFDIQDVGARFYTYISTMGLAMQAAAEHDIPFVVLDRPNPLGGVYAEGFILEPQHTSFVGQYPIPMAHGLTVGELALMIRGEGWMDGLENLDLSVVAMEGWTRDMMWSETGLPWIPPSPNIPTVGTALVYPGAVLFEATSASEGRGTEDPFMQVGAPWADGEALADTLNAAGLPGIAFEPASFTPRSIEGMSSNPKLEGRTVHGVRHRITDAGSFDPVRTGIHVIHAFYGQAVRQDVDDFVSRPEWMARLAGTERLLEMLTSGASPEEITAAWDAEVERFQSARQQYLLY